MENENRQNEAENCFFARQSVPVRPKWWVRRLVTNDVISGSTQLFTLGFMSPLCENSPRYTRW